MRVFLVQSTSSTKVGLYEIGSDNVKASINGGKVKRYPIHTFPNGKQAVKIGGQIWLLEDFK